MILIVNRETLVVRQKSHVSLPMAIGITFYDRILYPASSWTADRADLFDLNNLNRES